MQLCPVQQIPLEIVRAFVFQNEVYGIQLAERLEHYIRLDDKADSAGDFFCLTEGQILWAVVFASKAGLVLPCAPQNLPEAVFQLALPLIAKLFYGRRVYCVSGWSRGVQLMQSALGMALPVMENFVARQPVERRRYHFMCYDSRRCHHQLVPQLPVVRCSPDDVDGLYQLQSAYDTVEVLPKNHAFKPETCRANLLRVLDLGNVVAIPEPQDNPAEGRFMAKANFSAVSWRFALIGGVYTAERYRRKGCAARLVQWLGDEAAKGQRQAALFVREENLAARHAYENAGYFFSGNYEIVYY